MAFCKIFNGEKYRCLMTDKLTAWRILVLLGFLCVFMCIYLYTNAFEQSKSPPAFQQKRSTPTYNFYEEKFQTEWKDRLSDGAYYLNYRSMIHARKKLPVLTLFTSWQDSADKYLVHNLTSKNWLSLRPYVIPVIFTNERYVAAKCKKHGWKVLPIRVAAAEGIPVLKFMFSDVMAAINSTFYGYANSDILFTNQLVETLISIKNKIDVEKSAMIVGKRTNVHFVTKEEGSSWENIARASKERGTLFREDAEDYFVTTRTYPWNDIPEVVIGRKGYDNWLVYNARRSKHLVIDITPSSLAVHQTTEAGNFEGRGNKHSHYNIDILTDMYKSIKFDAGKVECINHETKYNVEGLIDIRSRPVPLSCSLVYDVKALYPVQRRVEKGFNWNRLICLLVCLYICLYIYREFLS